MVPLKEGVQAHSGGEPTSEVWVGYSYSWSLNKTGNICQDRWDFLRMGRGFQVKKS